MDKLSLKLYVGDKHLSSWSMRPWLLLKQFEIPFEEVVIRLDRNTTKEEIAKISPSGRVPALVDHDVMVWDSLAICEYLVEKFPRLALWPDSTRKRAWARSLCSEMHSGFSSLRKECPMDLLVVHHEGRKISTETHLDVLRIDKMFHDAREAHKKDGDYLFGEFGIIDAYFLPIISRFRTYGIALQQTGSVEYYNFMIGTPLFKNWLLEAGKAQ